MGNGVSREEKQEKKILRSPNVGQASDLYRASRAGDADAVRQISATTSFNDLNHLEPNGSTALHAASFFGHPDVVRLLLQERGVMRHRKNRHGLTAYKRQPTMKFVSCFIDQTAIVFPTTLLTIMEIFSTSLLINYQKMMAMMTKHPMTG
jgi:ankyrin repeat protein